MNKKDLSEIRRHMTKNKTGITRVYGCFFNSVRQVVSTFERPVADMTETELDMWLKRLKKPVSGQIGKAVYPIGMDTGASARADLMALYQSRLENPEMLRALFERIIEKIDMGEGEGNHLIVMAYDSYDVPARTSTGNIDRDSAEMTYSYIICCVCRVKDGSPELRYASSDGDFRLEELHFVVGEPLCGFVYPAFSERMPDYNSVSYCMRKQEFPHEELVDTLFQAEPPKTQNDRKAEFTHALSEAQEGACEFDTFCDIYRAVQRVEEVIDTEDSPVPAEGMTGEEVCTMLSGCGLSDEQVDTFRQNYTAERVRPAAIMDTGKLTVAAGDIKITVPESAMDLFTVKTVNGRRYIMIPTDIGVEINGFAVK